MALGSDSLVEEDSLVGGYRGVEVADRHALHRFSGDDAYHAGGILVDTVVLWCIDDARLVDVMQLGGDEPYVFLRQPGDALAEIVEETAYLLVFNARVDVVIGLEEIEQ